MIAKALDFIALYEKAGIHKDRVLIKVLLLIQDVSH
jgi:hypothetical protein